MCLVCNSGIVVKAKGEINLKENEDMERFEGSGE